MGQAANSIRELPLTPTSGRDLPGNAAMRVAVPARPAVHWVPRHRVDAHDPGSKYRRASTTGRHQILCGFISLVNLARDLTQRRGRLRTTQPLQPTQGSHLRHGTTTIQSLLASGVQPRHGVWLPASTIGTLAVANGNTVGTRNNRSEEPEAR